MPRSTDFGIGVHVHVHVHVHLHVGVGVGQSEVPSSKSRVSALQQPVEQAACLFLHGRFGALREGYGGAWALGLSVAINKHQLGPVRRAGRRAGRPPYAKCLEAGVSQLS